MRSTAFVTTRTGGGKRIYRRSHHTLDAAMADADRAFADGREVNITRRDLHEVNLTAVITTAATREGQHAR